MLIYNAGSFVLLTCVSLVVFADPLPHLLRDSVCKGLFGMHCPPKTWLILLLAAWVRLRPVSRALRQECMVSSSLTPFPPASRSYLAEDVHAKCLERFVSPWRSIKIAIIIRHSTKRRLFCRRLMSTHGCNLRFGPIETLRRFKNLHVVRVRLVLYVLSFCVFMSVWGCVTLS